MSAPKHIGSAEPFTHAAKSYMFNGWNVLPLPAKKKQSPPGKDDEPHFESFTGRAGRLATEEDIDSWLSMDRWAKGNIAIRPGNIVTVEGESYEALGIDIDSYGEKNGLSHLRQLEKTYGPLPNTWTSSARRDGVSGIRWYLAPAGYEYMGKPRLADGKASDSIEIVQRVHRYGVVFPSMHPDGMQYRWYATGTPPDGQHVADRIPRAQELAILPNAWWKFLSRNGIADAGASPIDMLSTDKEVRQWARVHFVDSEDVCDTMFKALEGHLDRIANNSDHHDPLVNAHWNLYKLGAEGHTGWATAVSIAEQAWQERVELDQSRSMVEARFEMQRSRFGALRKLKGLWDEWRAQGAEYLVTEDACATKAAWTGPPKRTVAQRDPCDYERNEDGNAEHFLKLNKTRVKFVVNHAEGPCWLVFSDKENRWLVDSKDTIVRNLFRQVKVRQQRSARRRLAAANLAVTAAGGPQPATPAQNAAVAEAKAWAKWGLESGNSARVTASLKQVTSFPGVSLMFEDLDRDPMLLPVANGVIKFATKAQVDAGAKPFEFLEDPKAVKSLLVTQNTHVPYIPFKEQRTHEDPEVREGHRKFVQYMNKFLKSQLGSEAWEYVLKLMGVSILGVNTKKAVFLVGEPHTGKSTFQNMMAKALGDLAIWRDPDIFNDSPFKPALAEALSRRVCMVGELGEKHIDAGLFKRITGGDEVSCNIKNVNKPVTLAARCTVISGCNSAPEVPHVDEATRDRFVVVPFKHQVTLDERDPKAIEDLPIACRYAMLAMLVEHASKGLLQGVHQIPAELQFATKEFVSQLSDMSDFLRDTVVRVPESEWVKYARNDTGDPREGKPRWPDELCIGDRDLYRKYENWCSNNGVSPAEKLSSTKFTRKMKDLGFVKDGSWSKSNQRRWIGVHLTAHAARVKEANG